MVDEHWIDDDDEVLFFEQRATGVCINKYNQIVIKQFVSKDEDQAVFFELSKIPALINSLLKNYYEAEGSDSEILLPDYCNDLTDALKDWRKKAGWK